MADYVAKVRSNYFGIKNEDAWQAFCDRFDFTNIMVWDKVKKRNLYGFVDNTGGGGLPSVVLDPATDEYVDANFQSELAQHLLDGEVAIVIEVGATKLAHLTGFAFAVNSKGEQRQVSLAEIYEEAKDLGENITPAEN